MNGELSEQPLAELVREISAKGLSGTLRLQHERVKAVIYFDHGRIIYAASNVRELRLSEYLEKQGLASKKQLAALGKNRSDVALTEQLRSAGIIDERVIEPLIARLVGDVLRVALLWTKGEWEFDARSHLGDSVRVKVDSSGLLLQTARKMNLKFVASRFPDLDEMLSPGAKLPDDNDLLPAEGFVLSRVESPLRVDDLIAISGLRELDTLRTLYGLTLAGFVERERWPVAIKIALTSQVVTAEDQMEAEPAAPPESEDHGEVDDTSEFLARLEQATTHYEVLSVDPTAALDEIKRSYYSLARRYHPDRFHMQASTPLHLQIESAFARIAQAYETLSNPSRRAGYDAKLSALEKSRQLAESAPKPKEHERSVISDAGTLDNEEFELAEENFKEGYSALEQGQIKLAITKLAAAARVVPKEPRYRAYYGRALGLLQETRRLAEAELQAAIKFEPANSSYRVMLAELYFDLGFLKRAEAELERARASEPGNPAVRKLMRRLEAERTTK